MHDYEKMWLIEWKNAFEYENIEYMALPYLITHLLTCKINRHLQIGIWTIVVVFISYEFAIRHTQFDYAFRLIFHFPGWIAASSLYIFLALHNTFLKSLAGHVYGYVLLSLMHVSWNMKAWGYEITEFYGIWIFILPCVLLFKNKRIAFGAVFYILYTVFIDQVIDISGTV